MDNRTERIAEGVWRIEPRWSINTYLVENPDGLTLVDTGTSSAGPSLVRSIRLLGFDPRDVGRVVLTHWHRDHMGSAARFAASSANPEVFIGRRDIAPATGRQPRPHEAAAPGDVTRLGRLLSPLFTPGPAVQQATALDDGQRIDGSDLIVVDSPGHTAGSISLHLPDRGVLLAGDALFNILRLTRGPATVRSARTDEAQTLQRLADLDFEVLGVGHGPPVVTDARARLGRLAQRLA